MRRTELMKKWKVPVPATIAGAVELVLCDPLTRQPKYGARTTLIAALLENWLDTIAEKPLSERKPIPSLEELRSL